MWHSKNFKHFTNKWTPIKIVQIVKTNSLFPILVLRVFSLMFWFSNDFVIEGRLYVFLVNMKQSNAFIGSTENSIKENSHKTLCQFGCYGSIFQLTLLCLVVTKRSHILTQTFIIYHNIYSMEITFQLRNHWNCTP